MGKILDHDNSGFLEREDLCALLSSGGATANLMRAHDDTEKLVPEFEGDTLAEDLLADGQTIDELMDELDTDGDGRVSFEEFRSYILRKNTPNAAEDNGSR